MKSFVGGEKEKEWERDERVGTMSLFHYCAKYATYLFREGRRKSKRRGKRKKSIIDDL